MSKSASFRHVWPQDPDISSLSDISGFPAWTCPTLGLMGIKGGLIPLQTLDPLLFSPSSLAASRCSQGNFWVSTPNPFNFRGFSSPNLRGLQTVVGFPLSKVFQGFFKTYTVLHRSLLLLCVICLVVPLGCLSPNLSLA
jgi:hypothetical protein